jgi:RNA polymerase sigma-70 factor, ECF subfamily
VRVVYDHDMAPRSSDPVPDHEMEVLSREAAAGNTDALTSLLRLHHDRLHEHAARKVGPDWRRKLDPEDVLQDAYFDIFAGIGSFAYRGRDSFYAWAVRIVDRRHVDQVRRWRAHKRDAARESEGARSDAGSSSYERLIHGSMRDSGTPSRLAGTREDVSAVMSGLARLPEDYRQVLRRVYLNEEPFSAVAAEMGRTEDAVRRLAGRALLRLRQIVDPGGG